MLEIVIPILILLGLIAAVGAVIYFVIRVRSGEAVSLPLRLLFRVYLYLISIVSIVMLVIGLSALVQVGLGAALSKEFSYAPAFVKTLPRMVEPPPDVRPLTPVVVEPTEEEQEAQREEGLDRAFKEGILNGLSLTLVGALVLGLHLWGRRRLEIEEERGGMLNRTHLILLLVIFGIVALVMLPSAIYDSLRYYILDYGDEFSRLRPGGRLAAAIVTVPVWAYYLSATLRAVRRQEADSVSTAPSVHPPDPLP